MRLSKLLTPPSLSIIPLSKVPLDAWLLKLSGTIAISGAGIAFLSAQITDLEARCAARQTCIDLRAPAKPRAGKGAPPKHNELTYGKNNDAT
jgi:hypothetical protein